jgi:hypothetical protein
MWTKQQMDADAAQRSAAPTLRSNKRERSSSGGSSSGSDEAG